MRSHLIAHLLLIGASASNYRIISKDLRELQGGGGGGGPVGVGGQGITCTGTDNLIASVTGPAAAPLRGSVGCVDQQAYSLRDTATDPITQGQMAYNIYGPMEAQPTSPADGAPVPDPTNSLIAPPSLPTSSPVAPSTSVEPLMPMVPSDPPMVMPSSAVTTNSPIGLVNPIGPTVRPTSTQAPVANGGGDEPQDDSGACLLSTVVTMLAWVSFVYLVT